MSIKKQDWDKIISLGLLATTALYSSRQAAAFLIASHILNYGFGCFLKYLEDHDKISKVNANLLFKHCNILFDVSMGFTKNAIQGFVATGVGAAYAPILGKAAALLVARVHVAASSLYNPLQNDEFDQSKFEKGNFNTKVHLLFPMLTTGVHMALNTIIKDTIDSYFEVPIGILASSAIMWNIKPDSSTKKKDVDIIEYVYTHASSFYVGHSVLNFCQSFLPKKIPYINRTQLCHGISNKVKAIFSMMIERYGLIK